MLAPALTAHTDLHRHHVAVAVAGPLTTEDHAAALTAACMPLPRTYGLIVNLSGVTVITEAVVISVIVWRFWSFWPTLL